MKLPALFAEPVKSMRSRIEESDDPQALLIKMVPTSNHGQTIRDIARTLRRQRARRGSA